MTSPIIPGYPKSDGISDKLKTITKEKHKLEILIHFRVWSLVTHKKIVSDHLITEPLFINKVKYGGTSPRPISRMTSLSATVRFQWLQYTAKGSVPRSTEII